MKSKGTRSGNMPTVFHRPIQIIPLSQHIFQLAIIRPIDIHAMLLKIAVEEINHVSNRDVPQPEIVRREERKRLEPPIVTEAFDQGCAEASIPRSHVFATVENNLCTQISCTYYLKYSTKEAP